MNKLKELWGKNKVLIVLGMILLVCVIAIITVIVSFFFGGSKSEYGNRLKDIDKHPITEEDKSSYISELENNEAVEKVEFSLKGKIIYLTITFKGDTALKDAQNIVSSSLAHISEDILGFYDINFIISSPKTENSEGFTLLGAHNAMGNRDEETGSKLYWNNNTPIESDEKE